MVTHIPEDSLRFRDQVVIVSGGMGGIGFATAKQFALEGACLVLADLAETLSDRLSSVIRECKSRGSPEVIAVPCDVSDESQVNATVDLALERFKRVDVVANIAGFMSFNPLEDFTEQDWWRHLNVNLMGPVFFTRRALQVMKPGCAIVNVSSIHALQTSAFTAPYAASKAALLS